MKKFPYIYFLFFILLFNILTLKGTHIFPYSTLFPLRGFLDALDTLFITQLLYHSNMRCKYPCKTTNFGCPLIPLFLLLKEDENKRGKNTFKSKNGEKKVLMSTEFHFTR